MLPDPAKQFFIESDAHEVYYPWTGFVLPGSLWGYLVADNAERRYLANLSRVYTVVSILIAAAVLPTAVKNDSDIILPAAVVISQLLYATFAISAVRRLTRIPARESFRLYAKSLGIAKLLWHSMLGLFSVLAIVALNYREPVYLVFFAFVIGDALMAVVALCGLHVARE